MSEAIWQRQALMVGGVISGANGSMERVVQYDVSHDMKQALGCVARIDLMPSSVSARNPWS